MKSQKEVLCSGYLIKLKLLWVRDCFRNSIEQPLINIDEINTRLDMISEFNDNAISREELREYLGSNI